MAADEAPRSTALVKRRVGGIEELDGNDYLRMTFVTVVDHNERARTHVSRPVLRRADDQTEIDRLIMALLRKLPGADPSVTIDTGRQYTVTWDGVRAPV